jgi:lactate permease
MQFLIALLPILVLFTMIVGFKKNIVISATTALLVLVATSFWWGLDSITLLAASLRGGFIATEIILIIFGALLIIEVVKRQDLFATIEHLFASITRDYRAQSLITAFALVYFIEGVAGFGTPAIVAVPIMVALGFKPLHAVVLSLIGDTVPVAFGAIGLPITFGVGSVIEGLSQNPTGVVNNVVLTTAALNIVASIFLAMIVVAMSIKMHRPKHGINSFLEFVPFAITSGLIVSIFGFLTAIFIGPELPSIIGGMFGVVLISIMAKNNILMPKTKLSQASNAQTSASVIHKEREQLWRASYPYLLLVGLLVLSRLPYLPFREWLQNIEISTSSLLGTTISYSVAPLFSASFILILCATLVLLISRKNIDSPKGIILDVVGTLKRPYLALLIVLAFVQIFIFSGESSSTDLASMPAVIAESISNFTGRLWPFFAPFIGALGSFVAGSATVSNLVFSSLQYDIATSSGLDPAKLLSLQTMGAAAGNMIALHNIVAALAIAGLSENNSHHVIKHNIIPLFVLLFVAGALGLLIT